MARNDQPAGRLHSSRRSILKAGGAATVASLLGLTGSAAAQEGDGSGNDTQGMSAWMFNDEVSPGTVFRVQSPALNNIPNVQGNAGSVVENATAHVIEYFNSHEQAVLLLPDGVQVEQGTIYQLSENMQMAQGGSSEGLVQVQFTRLQNQDFQFDLGAGDVQIVDGGGEGVVRPRNFSGGSIFRITSEPQGWVPENVQGSGVFTSYNTRHAEYIGADDEFLFFPQEGADVETDALYTVRDEFEFVNPAGNLVTVQFDRVDPESVPVDDEFL